MKNDPYFLKQVIFKLASEIDDRKEEMIEAASELYPEGCEILVKRGKREWKGIVFKKPVYDERFEVRFLSTSGQIHWARIEDIERTRS